MNSITLVAVALVALALSLAWAAGAGLRAQRLARQLAAGEQRLRETDAALARSETERAIAEAGHRASEQRYLLALQGSQDGLWEWQPGSDAVTLSPRWKAMLGYASDDLADTRAAWLGCVLLEDRAAYEAALLAHARSSDARFDLELRLRHRDGSVRHVLSRGVAIRDESGRAERLIGLDTDVTRLRRVQSVLDAVAEGTAGAHGDHFFQAMVQHFARALEVDCAFITECADQPPTRVRTLAFWSRQDGHQPAFEYPLAGTPCEEVIQGNCMTYHRSGVAERFPAEAGFESYIGLPVVGSDGRVLGHLAMLDSGVRGDELLVDLVYRIFLARAAAEIERLHALARLAAAAA